MFPGSDSAPFPSMFGYAMTWHLYFLVVFGCERSQPREVCNKTDAFRIEPISAKNNLLGINF